MSRLTSVVLPAPLGPISACRAPFSTLRQTLSVAMMPPKRFSRQTFDGFQHRGHAVTLLQARVCAATGEVPIGRSNFELAPSSGGTFFRARPEQSTPALGRSRIANIEE